MPIKTRHALISVVLFAALSACGGVAKRNASVYAQARAADIAEVRAEAELERAAAEARASKSASAAAACGTDKGCVQLVSAHSVLEEAIVALKAGNSTGRTATPVPYERDTAAKFGGMLRDATGIATVGINGYVAKVQSDNSTAVSIAQLNAWSGMTNAATSAARDAAVAAAENAGARYNVGGDYTNGDHVDVGNDYVSGTQHQGPEITGDGNATDGSHIGPTIIGNGNATDGSQVGDRAGRDVGPIDNSNPGDECTGPSCQAPPPDPTTPTDPIDPPPAP